MRQILPVVLVCCSSGAMRMLEATEEHDPTTQTVPSEGEHSTAIPVEGETASVEASEEGDRSAQWLEVEVEG